METKDIIKELDLPEGYELELLEENNVLNIIGEFNEEMLQMVYHFISELDEESDEPIMINISSRGGEMESLYAMIDLLKATGRELHGIVNGYAYSSALGLFCACDIRKMGKMSNLMYHKCAYGIETNLQGHKDYLSETLVMQRKYDDLILNASTLTEEELAEHKYRDWYISKDKAIELGIVNVMEL